MNFIKINNKINNQKILLIFFVLKKILQKYNSI